MDFSPLRQKIILDLATNRMYLQPGQKPPKGKVVHKGIRKPTARWVDTTSRSSTVIDTILRDKRSRSDLHTVVIDTLNNANRAHLDNPISTFLADTLGYHRSPKTIDDADFQSLIRSNENIPLIYRGVGGKSIEGFIDGSNKMQRCGAYGAGLYTAVSAVRNVFDPKSFGLSDTLSAGVISELRKYAKERDGAVLSVRNSERKLQKYRSEKEIITYYMENHSKHKYPSEYDEIIGSIMLKYPLIDPFELQSILNTYYSRLSEGVSIEDVLKEASHSKDVCDWEITDGELELERDEMDLSEADEALNTLIVSNGGKVLDIGMNTCEEYGMKKVPKRYPAGAYEIAYNYPQQGAGKILQITLDPSTKIANYGDIYTHQLDLSKYNFDRHMEYNLKKAANLDPGLKALLLGYDAMRIRKESTNAQSADYILIFNRGKIILSNKIIDKEEI